MNKHETSKEKLFDETRAFGFWNAIFLGIGSMVGTGIFTVIGEAGVIAGNLVTVSFLIGAIITPLCVIL